MAGDWLKFEKATLEKPEVFAIAEATGLDPDAVIGKLLRVWAWFDTHTESGNAKLVTSAFLDRVAGNAGFAAAMASVGWLVAEGGSIACPSFDRHNGKTAKNRAETARRVASHRSGVTQVNGSCNANPVTSALAREEKRREEAEAKEIVQPASPAAPVPDRMPDDIAKPAGPEARAKPRKPQTADRFAEFWAVYPVKKGKADALRHWKAQNLDPIADRIIEHVRRMEREDQQWRDGFIPHGSTYINGKRWEDEPVRPVDPRAATAPAPQKMGAAEALKQTETPLQRALGYLKHQHDLGAYGEGVAGEEAYQRLVEEAHAKHGQPPRVL